MRMAGPTFSIVCVHSGNYTALTHDFLMLCISILPSLPSTYPNWNPNPTFQTEGYTHFWRKKKTPNQYFPKSIFYSNTLHFNFGHFWEMNIITHKGMRIYVQWYLIHHTEITCWWHAAFSKQRNYHWSFPLRKM